MHVAEEMHEYSGRVNNGQVPLDDDAVETVKYKNQVDKFYQAKKVLSRRFLLVQSCHTRLTSGTSIALGKGFA